MDMGNYFCLTGRKAYLIGAMDGSFPPAGRLLGDEGGFWAPPIKLLDGFSLTIAETGDSPWDLQGCRNYQHQFSDNKLLFERSDYHRQQTGLRSRGQARPFLSANNS